jgi:hypothetical protein
VLARVGGAVLTKVLLLLLLLPLLRVMCCRTAMTCLTWARRCTASWCASETTSTCTG